MAISKLPNPRDLDLLRTRMSTQFQIPSAYDDALSYQNLIYKLMQYIEDGLDNIKDWNTYLWEFADTYDNKLKDSVLDILEKWYEQGIMDELVAGVIEIVNTRLNQQEELMNVLSDTLINNRSELLLEIENAKAQAENNLVEAKQEIQERMDPLEGEIFREGIAPEDVENLVNWGINDFYGKYNDLLSPNFTRETIGYGALSNGEADVSLPIYVYKYRNNLNHDDTGAKKLSVFVAGIHGNEKNGIYTLYNFVKNGVQQKGNKEFIRFWNDNNVDIIPIVNPYGVNRTINISNTERENNVGRYNARNVDLNRNFKYGWEEADGEKGTIAESERETKAVQAYFDTLINENLNVFVDFHDTFNISADKHISQVWFQAMAYLHPNLEIAQQATYLSKKYLNDEYGVNLNDQTLGMFGFNTVLREGMMVASFAETTERFQNTFIFESGKQYLETDGTLTWNHHKNVNAYIQLSHTIIPKLEQKNTTLYQQEINTTNIADENLWGNAFRPVGQHYKTGSQDSDVLLTTREPIWLNKNDKLLFYVPEKGYDVQIKFVNQEGEIIGSSYFTRVREQVITNVIIGVLLVITRKGSIISRAEIGRSFTPVLKIYKGINLASNEIASSNSNVTITFSDVNKNGNLITYAMDIKTTGLVTANSIVFSGIAEPHRNLRSIVNFVGSTNDSVAENYVFYWNEIEKAIATASEIPANKTIRFTFTYLTNE